MTYCKKANIRSCDQVSKSPTRGELIRRFILETVAQHPSDIAQVTGTEFGIGQQAVNKYLKGLVADGLLFTSGKTRNRRYALKSVDRTPLAAYDEAAFDEWEKAFEISPDLEEDAVWSHDIKCLLKGLSDSAMAIWNHGFTEMFNNAIDHSEGQSIAVYLDISADTTEIFLADDGIGIFKKIQQALNLSDERQAALELAKGKFTTAPDRHSGEGIFFSARMFDEFEILSNGISFTHRYDEDDYWTIEKDKKFPGTTVRMKLENHTVRSIERIFNQFSSGDEHSFNKTVVPVKLAQYGDSKLVSRSQAKRLSVRFDRFETVILDFEDVESVGQAFADEIFRVFQKLHPQIDLSFVNANRAVTNMIKRAKSHR